MGTKRYNPSSHGISAKIWECMRRNQEFRKDVGKLRSMQHIESGIPEKFGRFYDENPVAHEIFKEVVASFDTAVRKIEDKRWPNLPEKLRTVISDCVKQDMTPTPFSFKPFTVEPDARHPLTGKRIADQFDFVAIPKRVRDSEHRKSVLARLALRVPNAAVKGIHLRDDLPSGGKLLGTRKDWEQFLFVEQWCARTPKLSREEVLAIAAWYFYEKDTFNAGSACTKDGKKTAKEVYVRRGEKVRSNLAAVEKGIDSVYPVFRVF